MSATKTSPGTLSGPNEAASPLAAALFPSPPLEERGRERRSSFSASTPDLLVRQPAGTSPQTAASRMVRDLLSPTLSSKGGAGEPIPSCPGPPDACNAPARPSPAAAASRAPARVARHILLVEDESAILDFSTAVLVRGGYLVTAVEGCEAAWEAVQSASYDLLVTDNQMPGMSGLELVSKLRSAQIGMPIIVASGGVEAEEFSQNQSLQPAIALPKPFTADQLLETVAEALRRAGRDPAHTQVSFPAYGDSYSHWGLNE